MDGSHRLELPFTEPPLSRWTCCLVFALAGCDQQTVEIRAAIPGPDGVDAPVAGLPLKTLPYDRDSILRALEARAATPRPHTRELDSLFQAFRAPFLAFAAASYRERKLRDSLADLKLRLDSLPRAAPNYRELYLRFSQQADSLASATTARTRAQIPLDRARKTLVPRIDSLRSLVGRWEDSTFRVYDSVTDRLSKGLGREPTSDSTGPDGRAKLRLRAGRWWVYAHTWDVSDPYASWYWNVRLEGDSIVLDGRTGRRRPAY